MNVLPVLVRELNAESRRPANYWLRVVGPAALLLFFLLIALTKARLAHLPPNFLIILDGTAGSRVLSCCSVLSLICE